jgi:hypothetical protein
MRNDVVIMSAVAHILTRLTRLDSRMESMGVSIDAIADALDETGMDDAEGGQFTDSAAIAASLLDAADDIESSAYEVPNKAEVVERLRDIAYEVEGEE